ncbi:MAG: hypothetical protein ACTSR0_01615 [Candidatus Asgardarchaeia archaeon]
MEEIERKILSCIGKKVKFNYPEGKYYGKLKDRCILYAPSSWTKVPYWDVVDLIEFEEPERFEAIRFGYYRLKQGKLKWASQTTLTEPIEVYKKLFVKAAIEKVWFRNFLKEVLEEVKRHEK